MGSTSDDHDKRGLLKTQQPPPPSLAKDRRDSAAEDKNGSMAAAAAGTTLILNDTHMASSRAEQAGRCRRTKVSSANFVFCFVCVCVCVCLSLSLSLTYCKLQMQVWEREFSFIYVCIFLRRGTYKSTFRASELSWLTFRRAWTHPQRCSLCDPETSKHVSLAQPNGFGPAFLHSLIAEAGKRLGTCQKRV